MEEICQARYLSPSAVFIDGTHERIFADAKEKRAMRYTQYRGLAQVTKWVRLKFAAMNLKKLAKWKWKARSSCLLSFLFLNINTRNPAATWSAAGFLDRLKAISKSLMAFVHKKEKERGKMKL